MNKETIKQFVKRGFEIEIDKMMNSKIDPKKICSVENFEYGRKKNIKKSKRN